MSTAHSLIGQTIAGRYRVDALLGEGGMGAVYRATQEALGREVAIKVIRPDVLGEHSAVQRFEREARIIAQLNDPHVVTVHDFGTTPDGLLFIVMELLGGQSLGEHVEQHGAVAWQDTIPLIRGVAAALQAAHAKGVIHRDLKPDNVVLTGDGAGGVKVLDFGIAKLAQADEAGEGRPQTLTQAGIIVGTPGYMAPEVMLGSNNPGPQSDLYALGLLWLELLAGKAPIPQAATPSATIYQQLTKGAPTLDELAPGHNVPAAVLALITGLTEHEAKDRPRDAATVVAALDALGSTSAPTVGTPVPSALLPTASAVATGQYQGPHTAVPTLNPMGAATGPYAGHPGTQPGHAGTPHPGHGTPSGMVHPGHVPGTPATGAIMGTPAVGSTPLGTSPVTTAELAALIQANQQPRSSPVATVALVVIALVLVGGAGWFFGRAPEAAPAPVVATAPQAPAAAAPAPVAAAPAASPTAPQTAPVATGEPTITQLAPEAAPAAPTKARPAKAPAKKAEPRKTTARRTKRTRKAAAPVIKDVAPGNKTAQAKNEPAPLTSDTIRIGLNNMFGKALKCRNTVIRRTQNGGGISVDHCPSYKTVAGPKHVVFKLDPSGKVLDARFKDATGSTEIGGCILSSLESWKFPAFRGDGPVEITQRIQFSPCIPINGKCVFGG